MFIGCLAFFGGRGGLTREFWVVFEENSFGVWRAWFACIEVLGRAFSPLVLGWAVTWGFAPGCDGGRAVGAWSVGGEYGVCRFGNHEIGRKMARPEV